MLARHRVVASVASVSAGFLVCSACSSQPPPKEPEKPAPSNITSVPALAEEVHLADLRQLTKSGENAEAYWSWDAQQLILQSRTGDGDCDRIYRMPVSSGTLIPVSSGKGATTCSYFMPGNQEVIYASTHLGGEACPPKPDHSQGYVWALYDSYDIFKSKADGSGVVRLTDTKGYDAEGTVCKKDGSIVFTSVRDGDIDLYRMDADGKNVRRLTNTLGYDGGAFFNEDCSKIVWRASRPRPGKEQDDYKSLLAKNLVRPSKLELYTANADGSDPVQLTYLNAASFAPYWHPSQKRILFSSNYGDPKGREFDIWAIDTDGTNLERITHAGGFDGFPMFSPDGKLLAFSSNRATAPGKHDTNVFLARWVEGSAKRDVASSPPSKSESADRIAADLRWLADPAREGRGVATKGLEASGAYIEQRFQALGLAPAGDDNSFRQAFPVTTELRTADETKLTVGKDEWKREDYTVLGYSPALADAKADLVFANYGIVAKELGVDDYAGVKAKGAIVVVRRFVPEGGKFASTDAQRRYGDLRQKAWTAKERGARALIVVDDPAPPAGPDAKDWKAPAEARLPRLEIEGHGDAGIPVLAVKRAPFAESLAKLKAKARVPAQVHVALTEVRSNAFNVVARLPAGKADKLPGTLVIGAHYDHLGMGGHHSLAPNTVAPHVGADDNASGAATLLEIARELAKDKDALRRDVLFVAFSGEESGVLGSGYFVKAAKEGKKGGLDPKGVVAMLNMDMVGRMRENKLQVLGSDTAREWGDLVKGLCNEGARVDCSIGGDGYGPSDHMSFYTAGIPVLHFFTGTHSDYHKPSDTADKINYAGAARVGKLVADIARHVDVRPEPLTFQSGAQGAAPRGDMRSFNASLGTVPDYGGPGAGKKGVLLSGVRPGGAAEKGGMKRGDILIRLGEHEIGSVEDLMFVLNASKPNETVTAVVVREGKEVKLEVTFQESHRPR
ncbi:M20/M25/M40 family metallo-hydrolase [Pendulispora albinea]|uniref:M20/M25/M40 family metallo-hydrolase n=1 Tax=Pendulispora albinea TaxID=2741071 RepID=A0ABZ2LPN9_9BACT